MTRKTKRPPTVGYSAEMYGTPGTYGDGDGNIRPCTMHSFRLLLDGKELGWSRPQQNAKKVHDEALNVASRHRRGQDVAGYFASKPAGAELIGEFEVQNLLPYSVEEVAAQEAEREAVKRQREAAAEEKRDQQLKEIMAEENARNGRGRGITIRA